MIATMVISTSCQNIPDPKVSVGTVEVRSQSITMGKEIKSINTLASLRPKFGLSFNEIKVTKQKMNVNPRIASILPMLGEKTKENYHWFE